MACGAACWTPGSAFLGLNYTQKFHLQNYEFFIIPNIPPKFQINGKNLGNIPNNLKNRFAALEMLWQVNDNSISTLYMPIYIYTLDVNCSNLHYTQTQLMHVITARFSTAQLCWTRTGTQWERVELPPGQPLLKLSSAGFSWQLLAWVRHYFSSNSLIVDGSITLSIPLYYKVGL